MRQGFVLGLLVVSLVAGNQSFGQDQNHQDPRKGQQTLPTRMLRLYEDDDYINIKGRGTDEAYTNGSRVDLFYTRHDPPHWFLDRALPKAGDSSVDVYGWGIMQVMYTPRRINDPDFQPDDYPWSGGLFVTHSLYSYNPKANYDLQTEVVAGVIGPASLAGGFQKAFHHLIHYTQPVGWGHQFRNDLLLNINLTIEKQVFAVNSGADPLLELIGGGSIHAGTMENKMSVYSLLRLGIMHPYFDGLMSQYASGSSPDKKDHLQLYFFARPQADLVYTNAILEGGMFTHPPHGGSNAGAQDSGSAGSQPGAQTAASASSAAASSPKTTPQSAAAAKGLTSYRPLRSYTYSIDYGAVLALRTWSLSFTQSWSSALMRGLYSHEVGNISLYIGM